MGDVVVSRSTVNAGAGTYAWTVTFTPESFVSNVYATPTLTADGAGLSGGSLSGVTHTTAVTTANDLTPFIDRCDTVVINGNEFKVHACLLWVWGRGRGGGG